MMLLLLIMYCTTTPFTILCWCASRARPQPAPTALLLRCLSSGALQRAFTDRLREWHYQRNLGTLYQVWNPPGVVFSQLRKDHYEHGRYIPAWSEWGFGEEERPLRLVLRAHGGRWAVRQARRWQQENWVVVESDDSYLFNSFLRAMNAFGLEPVDPDRSFPNLRFVHTNERLAPKFFAVRSLRSVHVHLPWAARTTRPPRAALITPKFVADVNDALEEQGELHIVADDEGVAQEACAVLTRSKRFAPCLAFPFHEANVPAAYPAGDLLSSDVAENREGALAQQFFYTRWEKRPPDLPNFRFQGGRGYGEASILGLPE